MIDAALLAPDLPRAHHAAGPSRAARPACARSRACSTTRSLPHSTAGKSPQAEASAVLAAHPAELSSNALEKAVPETGIVAHRCRHLDEPEKLGGGADARSAPPTPRSTTSIPGTADNVFVAARPPGHHAERTTAMGFCLFNNAAIAARHAQAEHGAERVAIVDWDVHHGNGTQDIFWDDPSVLYCSTHQMPLYPGTGAKDETRRRQHRQRAAVARHRQRPLPRGVPCRASCRRSTISART